MIKDLHAFTSNGLVRSYGTGSIILYQGEVPRYGCVLKSGVVRACTISSAGDEQIISFYQAGDVFPLAWLFGKTSSTLYFYEASSDCEVAMVPKQELVDFMQHPSRMPSIMDYLITEHAASSIRISALEQPKARDKLTYTLYYLSRRYGVAAGADKAHISLSLTHQNLGALVGLTRETTATEMSKLKKEGILSYKNQKYTVNIERLLDLIGEDSFRGIEISGK